MNHLRGSSSSNRRAAFHCAFVTIATAFALANGAAVRADSWAIVVGVNEYPLVEIGESSSPPPLKGAEGDADAISSLLIDQFEFPKEHVQLIKGADATFAKLQAAFSEVTRQAQPEDIFVFHFSGHGTRVPDRRPFDEDDDLDEALCLVDTNGDGENLLIDDDLALWLDDLPARQVSVILDCCHAGTGTKGPDDDLAPRFLRLSVTTDPVAPPKHAWREFRNITKNGKRRLTAFFACHADQQAYERRFPHVKAPAKGGQFTQALLAGLRDSAADANAAADVNADGITTNQELLQFTNEWLDKKFNHMRTIQTEKQEPLLESEDADAPVFGFNDK